MSLRNREVIVAGGTGGLGSETVLFLESEGARVISSSRTGGTIRADITRAEDRAYLLDAASNLYGLVVFTGTPARGKAEEAMQLSHDVNYAGPILLAREAADRLRDRGTPGSIVLLSTMQAVALFPGSTVYAAEKAALTHAARILAKECRGRVNIRVNVIAPGVMNAGMAMPSIEAGKYDRYLAEDVIGRYGRAMDIARAVRFFLEPDNYITGQVLSVDGGITL